ncbi:ABC transporter permease [Agromyces bauzanensis]|uniref:ABC transporter permease n=1 Tax=Agromyces bauzanensis TaxID=1308924 RepID=A0A917PUY4_9MICO|nr:ABC transporter permease [Agromyces bauzanensis]GGJ93858.1 ABC transporter permease [Agromyces bauzanensis]
MGTILTITGRNLRLFFRDPLNVFFSLLGALIVFLLYTLFLGDLQVTSITDSIPGADEAEVRGFVDAWMFAGVVALTTMTTPLGALSVFVEDASTGRFRDFLVSPLRRGQLVLGYLLSAFLIGLAMTVIVLAVALLYLWLLPGVVLDVGRVAASVGWVVVSTAGFTALWAFVVSFLRTTGSFAALSTIVGTVAGFVAGAYIAVGLFPDAVRDTVSALPFAQSAMLLRRQFTATALSDLVGGQQAAIDELSAFYGITLHVGDWMVPVWFAAGLLAVIAVAFAGLAASRIRTRIR